MYNKVDRFSISLSLHLLLEWMYTCAIEMVFLGVNRENEVAAWWRRFCLAHHLRRWEKHEILVSGFSGLVTRWLAACRIAPPRFLLLLLLLLPPSVVVAYFTSVCLRLYNNNNNNSNSNLEVRDGVCVCVYSHFNSPRSSTIYTTLLAALDDVFSLRKDLGLIELLALLFFILPLFTSRADII